MFSRNEIPFHVARYEPNELCKQSHLLEIFSRFMNLIFIDDCSATAIINTTN